MRGSYSKSNRGRKYPSRDKRGCKPRRIVRQALAQAEQVHLPLSIEGLVEMARQSLSSFAVEVGLRMAECLLEDEVARRCGPRYGRPADRSETRYGHQGGYVTIAGQKVPVRKPRVRRINGRGEAELAHYALLQSAGVMPESALAKMVNGVSCRRYERVVDLARESFGVKKSSVSRGFVRASAEQLQQLALRRFHEERFAVIFIDAQPYASEMMVVALGITTAGEKRLLGLRQGATENAAVCC
jgi:putative transposase